MTIAVTEPCGRCPGCRLRAEIVSVLAMVDRRMLPAVFDAVRNIERERANAEPNRYALDAYHRSARIAKAQWQESRDRFMRSDVVRGTACSELRLVYTVRDMDRPGEWEDFVRVWGWIGIAAASDRARASR